MRVLKDSDAKVLTKTMRGQVVYSGKQWTIIYNDKMTVDQIRFTLAHEIGHMYLQHNLYKPKDRIIQPVFRSYPSAEKQANMFAERLLCPSCVLAALDPQSPEEIVELCHVELSVAKRRYKRMLELNNRNKYLTDPLEKELYELFLPFINERKGLSQQSNDGEQNKIILP